MAHVQPCTTCGKKVTCLSCSRKSLKKREAPVRVVSEVCDLCGFGGSSCDCGGLDDGGGFDDGDEMVDELNDDDFDDSAYGGGGHAMPWGAAAAAFLTDDDEDPLGDEDAEEEDTSLWTQQPKKKSPTRQQPKSQGYMYVDAVTTAPVARTKKTSVSGAKGTQMRSMSLAEFRRLYPTTKPMLNTSQAMAGTDARTGSEIPFSLWAKSIGTITQRFDNPTDYMPVRSALINGQIVKGKFHGGFDLAKLPIGQPITAFRGGRVIEVSGNTASTKGWGLSIVIKDQEGRTHRYAHLNSANVRNGDYIKSGELIGTMGRSGTVFGRTGIHLHYEIKDKYGTLISPEDL